MAFDRQGMCMYANQTSLEALSYQSEDEIRGIPINVIWPAFTQDGGKYNDTDFSRYYLYDSRVSTNSIPIQLTRKNHSILNVLARYFELPGTSQNEGCVLIFSLSSHFPENIQHNPPPAPAKTAINYFRKQVQDPTLYSEVNPTPKLTDIDTDHSPRNWMEPWKYQPHDIVVQPMFKHVPENISPTEHETLKLIYKGFKVKQIGQITPTVGGESLVVPLIVSPLVSAAFVTQYASTKLGDDMTKPEIDPEELAKLRHEETSRLKSEFMTNISHELRTPMNSIIGMVELALNNTEITPILSDYLETARESSYMLLALLNNLLDLSQLETGALVLDSKPFHLRQIVEETLRTLDAKANIKGLELTCKIAAEVPDLLRGDPKRLRQVIFNLVGNSIKFTEQGQVAVEISLVENAELINEKVQLSLVVSDTGIGIAADKLAVIMEPFIQVDSTTTRQQTGAGIGLTLCREFIHKMHGEIEIVSVEGEGTTVRCTPQFQRLDENASRNQFMFPVLRGRHVMILDEESAHRNIYQEIFERWGMKSLSASTVDETITHLQSAVTNQQEVEFGLFDYQLSAANDWELIKTLHAEKLLPKYVIFMMSSSAITPLPTEIVETEHSTILEKPITQSALFDSLASVLSNTNPASSYVISNLPRNKQAPLRILVVEDLLANQKVVRSILKQRGHVVDVVSDGAQAVIAETSFHYDLIFMDIQMPVMDGLKATRQIRNHPEPVVANVPVVALTAHSLKDDRLRCYQAGMNGYLAKPIDANKLIEIAERYMHWQDDPDRAVNRDAKIDAAHDTLHLQKAVTVTQNPSLLQQACPMVNSNPSSSPNNFESEVIDLVDTLDRMGGDKELMEEMASLYMEDIVELTHKLDIALKAQDFSEIARMAHSIKGLSSNFGAHICVDKALKMENTANTHEMTGLDTMFKGLKSEIDKVIQALKQAFPSIQ